MIKRSVPTILTTVLVFSVMLPLQTAGRHWIAKTGQEGNHGLYILPPPLVAGDDLEEDADRQVPVLIPSFVGPPRPGLGAGPMAWVSDSDVAVDRPRIGDHSGPGNIRPSMRKRQVRYHQCYFNPISCFG